MNNSLVFIFLFCNLAFTLEPMEYAKKPDIKTSSEVIGDKIYFNFGFKDLNDSYQSWDWNDDFKKLVQKSQQFGLPLKDPNDLRFYDSELPQALYKHHPEIGIIPDYSAIVSYYYDSVTPLYRLWSGYVSAHQLDQRQAVELLLRFFQDYPYGVPPDVIDQRLVKGLFVPPLTMQYGWADCDSKSLFMATVLAHDPILRNRLAIILVPGHAFLGIEMRSLVYDEKYEYRNRSFIVAEPTGLSRTPLGRKNSPYSTLVGIEPIVVSINESMSNGSSASQDLGADIKILTQKDCPDGGLLLDYISAIEGGRVQMCGIRIDGKMIKHGPEIKFNSSGVPVSKNIYNKGNKI